MKNTYQQADLVLFLKSTESYPHEVIKVEHIETHISHIFLTGTFAYKLKKPIRLDFLDFRSLQDRKIACENEFNLNTRFAPEIYQEIVPIFQNQGKFSFTPEGVVVDYLVKMKQFKSSELFSSLLSKNELTENMLRDLTVSISKFHKDATKTPDFFGIEDIKMLFSDNFELLTKSGWPTAEIEALVRHAILANESLLRTRQKTSVKYLHGDLHLGNICLYQGSPTPFDGIEFNKAYACCDVWADIAFLIMDLLYRDRSDLAYVVINEYLEQTDDYQGLPLLALYIAYRASVRAKIAALSSLPHNQDQGKTEVANYLQLIRKVLSQGFRFGLAIGGLSGTGKSTLGRIFASKLCAIHIRSDAVRKHLAQVPLNQHATNTFYTPEFSARVYSEVFVRASVAINSGYSIIIDAAFLDPSERKNCELLFAKHKKVFHGIWCVVSENTALRRINSRHSDISDASVQVYKKQLELNLGKIEWHKLDCEASPHAVAETAIQFLNLSPQLTFSMDKAHHEQ